MGTRRKMWSSIALAAAVVFTGCGGKGTGGQSAKTPGGFIPETKAQGMGAEGGSASFTLADGTAFQVEVPAGALRSPVTLTLTTQRPREGQLFNVLLGPAGLVLAGGAAATITVALPSARSFPSTGGVVYDGAPVPLSVLPDGRVKVSLSALAAAPAPAQATSLLASAAALLSPSARSASSTSACGGVPALEGEGGLVAVDAVEIEIYGQCMVSAVNQLAASEQFAEAVRAASAVAAYLQRTGTGDASPFITQASDIACVASASALDRARNTTVTGMGVLYGLTKPILFWETVLEDLGATCPDIPPNEYESVINSKTTEAIAYYGQEKPNITSTSSAAYAQAKAEAEESTQTVNEVLALAPSSRVGNTVTAQITERAQPGVLDALLQAPWQRCRDASNYDELIDLMITLGSPGAVKTAAHYCGAVLNAQAKRADGTVKAQLSQPLGGVSSSEKRTSGNLGANRDGKVAIAGPIQALQCPPGSEGGSETLVVKLDGTTVQTLSPGPYLTGELDIDVAAALAAAHPGATDQLTEASLTIERSGAPCNGFWGDSPAPLLKLTLAFEAMTVVLTDLIAKVTGADPAPVGVYEVWPDYAELRETGALALPRSGSVTDGHGQLARGTALLPTSREVALDAEVTTAPAGFFVDVLAAGFFRVTAHEAGTLTITLNAAFFDVLGTPNPDFWIGQVGAMVGATRVTDDEFRSTLWDIELNGSYPDRPQTPEKTLTVMPGDSFLIGLYAYSDAFGSHGVGRAATITFTSP